MARSRAEDQAHQNLIITMPISPENKARYPKDWKLRSKFIRFVRAKGLCERCGVANGAKGVWGADGKFYEAGKGLDLLGVATKYITIVTTTAHIFDDRPEAAGFLNLMALCQRCHNSHDAPMCRANAAITRDKKKGQIRLL